MFDALNEINTRETALLIWLALAAIGAVAYPPVRQSLGTLFRILLSPKIAGVITALMVYTSLLVLGFARLGVWQLWMLKDTLFWLFGSGLILLFKITRATEHEGFFKEAALDGIRLIAVLEFVLNVYTFPLLVELILLPVLAALAILSAVADTEKRFHSVKRLITGILALYGIGLVVYALASIILSFHDFASFKRLEDFLVPIVLTLLAIPFYYLFALIMLYESLFTRLNMRVRNPKLQRFAKLAILKACGFRLAKARRFAKDGLHEIGGSDDRTDIERSIVKFS
jgi:hypothetical protein